MSDNAATDGGQWRSVRSDDPGRGECWRRVSERVQLLVVGETRSQRCNGGGEDWSAVRRFARAIKVGASADSGGRQTKLLKLKLLRQAAE